MHERTTPNKLSKQRKATIQRNGWEVAINEDKSILSLTQLQSTLSASTQRMAFPKKKSKRNNKIARLLLAEFRNHQMKSWLHVLETKGNKLNKP